MSKLARLDVLNPVVSSFNLYHLFCNAINGQSNAIFHFYCSLYFVCVRAR